MQMMQMNDLHQQLSSPLVSTDTQVIQHWFSGPLSRSHGSNFDLATQVYTWLLGFKLEPSGVHMRKSNFELCDMENRLVNQCSMLFLGAI